MKVYQWVIAFSFLLICSSAYSQSSDTLYLEKYVDEGRAKEQVIKDVYRRVQQSEGMVSSIDSLRNTISRTDSLYPSQLPKPTIRKKSETLPDYMAELERRKKRKN